MSIKTLDPVEYEVFYHKLDALLNEAKETIRYLSGSVITRESGEVQIAFYLPTGEVVHIACGILMHVLNVSRVINYMKQHNFAEDIGIYEGDQFINNDAYIGGMHVPDVSITAPIYYKGEHLGYVAAISHHSETGAIDPVGMTPAAKEVWHDGLILPVVKLVEKSKMRRDILNTILRGVRDQRGVELDLRAKLSGNEMAKKKLTELIDEFGIEFFKTACIQLIKDGEKQSRYKLTKFQPGIYRTRVFYDCFGEIEKLSIIQLDLEITSKGELFLNLPVVSPQGKCFDNAYLPALEATSLYILLTLIFYDVRWNGGIKNIFQVNVPENSRLHASEDASVGYATVGIAMAYASALTEAISRALYLAKMEEDIMGASVPMNCTPVGGIDQYGRRCGNLLTSSSMAAGGGARIDKDGHDSSCAMYNPWTNVADTEGEEAIMPVIHLSRKQRANSGGYGKYRGGVGVEQVTMIWGSDTIKVLHLGSTGKHPVNQGLFGGYPGSASYHNWMLNNNILEKLNSGTEIPYQSNEISKILQGDFLPGPPTALGRNLHTGDLWASSSCSGGAGLGDPLERDPILVVSDIDKGLTTPEVAENIYGVVLDNTTEIINYNFEKTNLLREKKRKDRISQGIAGGKYLAMLVEKRRKRQLPLPALELLEETIAFSPFFKEQLLQEEEFVLLDWMPLKKGNIVNELFSITPAIKVVEIETGEKVTSCTKCNFILGNYKHNFKLYCLINERSSKQVFPEEGQLAYDDDWCVFREFYCPNCGTQVEVEAVPPGMPILNSYQITYQEPKGD